MSMNHINYIKNFLRDIKCKPVLYIHSISCKCFLAQKYRRMYQNVIIVNKYKLYESGYS